MVEQESKKVLVTEGIDSEHIKKILESEEGLEVVTAPPQTKLNRALGLLSSMPEEAFFELVKEYEPKANCNKCYGRGYTGILTENRNHIVCKCVRKKVMESDV